MSRQIKILTALVFLCTFYGIDSTLAQCLTDNDDRPPNKQDVQQALYVGQQQFSLDMLHEINKLDPTASVFFSPYSTYHALLLAYFISRNQTEDSIKNALRIADEQDKLDTFRAYRFEKYLRSMTADSNSSYEFASANRIYVAPEAGVRECMNQTFSDELEQLDFHSDPEAARNYINDWVEEITKNQIKNLLIPGAIDQSTNLVLVNAAYFKGKWESQFDPEFTTKSVFYISGFEKTFVDMMTQEGTFNHDVSEALGAHVLELPYMGNDVSMFIFLPPFATGTGVDNVLANLNVTTFQELVKEGGMYPKKVVVSLPKFAMEQTVELRPVMEAMGVGDLFEQTADLSGLTGQRNVDVGDAIHKAKIEVNEEGTKSAAATAYFTFRSSRPVEPAMFICNHPFIYVIYDRSSQAILFSGVFRKP